MLPSCLLTVSELPGILPPASFSHSANVQMHGDSHPKAEPKKVTPQQLLGGNAVSWAAKISQLTNK